jgi:predicted DsbA family dithiol-disulfide isomerase
VSKYEWYKTEKYQNSEARMNMYIDYMTALGKDDDIAFEFREGMIANTFHAHRILHHIQDHYSASAALAALQSLYSQYFEQGQHPSSASTLTKACLAAGLDEDDARNLVGDEEMQARETREAIREQVGNAVDSVPSVVFEGRKRDFTMVEAKSTEEYEKVMRQVEKEAM